MKKNDILLNNNDKNELLRQDQENEIKKLQLIINDLNLKINENNDNNKNSNNNESKGKEDQIEFLLTENQELKNLLDKTF